MIKKTSRTASHYSHQRCFQTLSNINLAPVFILLFTTYSADRQEKNGVDVTG